MLSNLETLNRVFEASIAVTALSLFLRALTFNLRDRVSRSFAVILACVMIGSAGEAVSDSLPLTANVEFWLYFQWIGSIFLPAAFLHFSDALLETTGRPSRGRRRLAVRLSYVISSVFLLMLIGGMLLGPAVLAREPVPHLTRTSMSWIFTAYYALFMLLAMFTIWRAWQRAVLSTSHRRLMYLFYGSLALAFSAYPFLTLGSGLAVRFPEAFFLSAAIGNILVFWALVTMAYSTAFFGVPWPDRVVKSRLFRWMMRGPVFAFLLLSLVPLGNRLSVWFGAQPTIVFPILMAVATLLVSHGFTIAIPYLERWLLFGGEAVDVEFVQNLQERVLTNADLHQFLEALLAAVCDRLQSRSAFVIALEDGQMRSVVEVGKDKPLQSKQSPAELQKAVEQHNGTPSVFSWGKFWVLPLRSLENKQLVGLLGAARDRRKQLAEDQTEALAELGERATMALENRRLQTEALQSLQSVGAGVELVQRLRAASRFDQSEMLSEFAELPEYSDLVGWVKDALTHYWGGPKLTESPLRSLQVVQEALDENEGNPAQAMRSILRTAIERNKPEGEPKLNGEWMLYNLLELKFLQGRKVREVAMRLAMSEADLYRKQRVAIESVARSLLEMETQAINQSNGKESQG